MRMLDSALSAEEAREAALAARKRAVAASAASRLSLAVLRAACRSPVWLRPRQYRVSLRCVACGVPSCRLVRVRSYVSHGDFS